MGDPGLQACREVVSIPVVGPSQAAMHVASLLGHRFSFITVLDRLRAMVDKLVAGYGLRDTYASFRAVDIPVLSIGIDFAALNAALAREAIAAVKQDAADVIVLGCTGFLGCAGGMRKRTARRGPRRARDRPDSARRRRRRRTREGRPLAQQAQLPACPAARRSKGFPFPEIADP